MHLDKNEFTLQHNHSYINHISLTKVMENHKITEYNVTYQYIVYASACAGSRMLGSFNNSCIPSRIYK